MVCSAPADAIATCRAGVCESTCADGYVACAAGCCAATGVIAAGDQGSYALTPQGVVEAWGYQGFFDGFVAGADVWTTAKPVPLLTDPLRHVAASKHRCAVTKAGKAVCWGRGTQGQLGNNSELDSSTPVGVAGLGSGVRGISTGASHSCAVTDAGGVKCWGDRLSGQFGASSPLGSAKTPIDVPAIVDAVGVTSGGYHACAWTRSGAVQCWGNNSYGQLGDDSKTSSPTPVSAKGLTDVVLLSAGSQHTCALTKAGQVRCWGSGRAVGGATVDGSQVPVVVSVGAARAIGAGTAHSCAVTVAGAVYCWGENDVGQLGEPTSTGSLTPVAVGGAFTAVAVAAGRNHTCALTTSGGAKCWGNNWLGPLGDGNRTATDASSPTPTDVLGFP